MTDKVQCFCVGCARVWQFTLLEKFRRFSYQKSTSVVYSSGFPLFETNRGQFWKSMTGSKLLFFFLYQQELVSVTYDEDISLRETHTENQQCRVRPEWQHHSKQSSWTLLLHKIALLLLSPPDWLHHLDSEKNYNKENFLSLFLRKKKTKKFRIVIQHK